MPLSSVVNLFKSREHRFAFAVAVAADAVQIFMLPLFAMGAASPVDTAIDLIAAVILSRLIGWHWAFLPTLFAELVPGLDLFPTWTAAVLYVSWQHPPSTQEGMARTRLLPTR